MGLLLLLLLRRRHHTMCHLHEVGMATLRDRIGFLMFHQFREGGYGARSGLARKVTADFYFFSGEMSNF